MKTYLIQSGSIYKIGRTTNVNQRFSELSAHNFEMKMISFVNGDYEKQLHRKFKDKRIKREWFALTDDDIIYIMDVFKNPSKEEIEYKDYIIDFGKYEGRYLISMQTEQEIDYIKHLSYSPIKVPFFKHWYENHLRYINIIICKKFYGKQIDYLKEYKLHLSSDVVQKKIEIIEGIGKELNIKTIPDYCKENNISYNGAKNHRRIVKIFNVTFVIDNP